MIIIREDKIPRAKETLNDEQLVAFDEIMAFLNEPFSEYHLLEGYAGTGKTYLIGRLIRCIHRNTFIHMTAPTNKAVKVMTESSKNLAHVRYTTIHKILCLKVEYDFNDKDQDGNPRQILRKNPFAEIDWSQFDLIILDEVSMLNEVVFNELNNEKPKRVKVLFVGDPAQIPPVKEVDSIPLTEEGRFTYQIGRSVLNKIMRQAEGNSIIGVATQIRNNRFTRNDWSRVESDNVKLYSSSCNEDKEEFRSLILQHFSSDNFFNDSDYCKVIAWTNKQVDGINTMIRMFIFKKEYNELEPLMVGERVIADTPFFGCIGLIPTSDIILNVSDEMRIMSLEVCNYEYIVPDYEMSREQKASDIFGGAGYVSSGLKYNIKYYKARVSHRLTKDSDVVIYDVNIIHPDGRRWLTIAKATLAKQRQFKEYYKLAQAFGEVKYNYAITCHKAQGSTYDNTFIIEDDIDKNRLIIEMNRIKYTAMTRARHCMHVLSIKNPHRVRS